MGEHERGQSPSQTIHQRTRLLMLVRFYAFPLGESLFRSFNSFLAEDMRVPLNQFPDQVPNDIGNVEPIGFARHLRMEDNLK